MAEENTAATNMADLSLTEAAAAEMGGSSSEKSSSQQQSSEKPKTDPSKTLEPGEEPVVLGICAMDVKARSKAMREILTRVVEKLGATVDIKIFGDIVILEEEISHWPRVDILISFFSADFPLDKAIRYTRLPDPTKPGLEAINSLEMQSLLWDRRLVLCILDHIGVPTPRRAEVSRDGGPKVDDDLRALLKQQLGLVLPSVSGYTAYDTPVGEASEIPERWRASRERSASMGLLKDLRDVPRAAEVILRDDGDAIIVNGHVVEKPFVEKPVSGEDHNVYIYYRGGGGRKLFRKVGNKSSEYDPTLTHPRCEGSFIYEEFINVDNAEDIKIYTVGTEYTHAETRKSPVVDGLVRRNADGKETRLVTQLSDVEKAWARDVVDAFGQRVCGFDLLRCTDEEGSRRSLIIDVNGWSFVKGNQSYYDKAAEILAKLCERSRARKRTFAQAAAKQVNQEAVKKTKEEMPAPSSSTLRATVTVFRHADRTPKMKLKFTFPAGEAWTAPFFKLLRGHKEEIILRDEKQLNFILQAADEAAELGCTPEIHHKLGQLKEVLGKKIGTQGTKAQLKPGFKKKGDKKDKKDKDTKVDAEPDSQSRVKEWIEESLATPTLKNAEPVFSPTTSERSRAEGSQTSLDDNPIPEGLEKLQLVVKWGGESTHSAKYQSRDLGDTFKKDLMIMNKDVLNNVRVYTSSEKRVVNTAQIFAHALLGEQAPPPSATTGSSGALRQALADQYDSPQIEHIIQRRDLLDDNNAAKELIDQAKRKLKILLRPGESEKRPELAWPKSLKKEPAEVVKEVIEQMTELREIMRRNYANGNADKIQQRWCSGDNGWLFRERWEKLFEDFVGIKQEKFDPSRVSELYDSLKYDALHNRPFLLAVFDPEGRSGGQDGKASADRRLHELLARAQALFDLVAPQEYGIDMTEKEEIGVLTSLPLLRKIVTDLAEARETGNSTANFYFTKESHITTLLHLILASGVPLIPNVPSLSLDYCSSITFELYERVTGSGSKDHSIRIAVSEGAHSSALLDSSVDVRHTLTVQPRRKITTHVPFDQATAALSKHFNRGLSFSTTPLEVSRRVGSPPEFFADVCSIPFLHFLTAGRRCIPQEIYSRRSCPAFDVISSRG